MLYLFVFGFISANPYICMHIHEYFTTVPVVPEVSMSVKAQLTLYCLLPIAGPSFDQ